MFIGVLSNHVVTVDRVKKAIKEDKVYANILEKYRHTMTDKQKSILGNA